MRKGIKALIIVMMLLPFIFVLLLFTSSKRSEVGEPSKYVIGFVETVTEDSGKARINESVRRVCSEQPYQMLRMAADRERASQIEAMRSLIAYKVDLIIVSPVVARDWENVLKEAAEAKIPVLTIDKGIIEEVDGVAISYLGFDYYEAGKQLAQSYLEAVSEDQVTLELCGTVGSYSALQITKGFRDVLRSETTAKDDLISYSLSEDFLQLRAQQATRRMISLTGALDVVVSHGDAMTIGAVEAIREAGLVPGEDIQVYAISCSEEVRRMAEAGSVNCIAFSDTALMSEALSEALARILDDRDAGVEMTLPVQMIRGGDS